MAGLALIPLSLALCPCLGSDQLATFTKSLLRDESSDSECSLCFQSDPPQQKLAASTIRAAAQEAGKGSI